MAGCSSVNTLGHMLSACNKSLDRFSFRHDSVLTHLLKTINANKKEGVTTFADLNGWRVNGGTVPPELTLTNQIPDLVIIDRSVTPAKVVLLELTVPWDAATNSRQPVTGNWRGTSGWPWTFGRRATLWPTCPWKSGAGVSSTRETP